jgi:hypothetical protein
MNRNDKELNITAYWSVSNITHSLMGKILLRNETQPSVFCSNLTASSDKKL